MMMIRAVILWITLWANQCAAQDQPRPDGKDYAIEAIQRQRNDALTREVVCRAETGPELDALREEVENLKHRWRPSRMWRERREGP